LGLRLAITIAAASSSCWSGAARARTADLTRPWRRLATD